MLTFVNTLTGYVFVEFLFELAYFMSERSEQYRLI